MTRLDDTGRLRAPLLAAARHVLFERLSPSDLEHELWLMTEVDRAHVVMLAARDLVSRSAAAALIRAIDRLRDEAFAQLQGRPSIRGLYLMYEDYLIETESAAVGGILQTARSRNDLQATVLKLRLREPVARLLAEGLRLLAVLVSRARRHADVVMPLHTHARPAVASTYGHYLSAVAQALTRELAAIDSAAAGLDRSPLGAGAAGGTTWAIDADYTAQLLGFRGPMLNSLDAVASRDDVLRLLAAASGTGVLLGRLATDLLQWSRAEPAFLSMPDTIVGSSSAMPQKRNPFLLEHVQGRAAAPLGAFVAAATAMHATPFTHSIAVGTEAVKPAMAALREVGEALLLARLVVSHTVPRRDAMLEQARRSFVTAVEVAHAIVRATGMDFRSAHHTVGAAVHEAEQPDGSIDLAIVEASLRRQGLAISMASLTPEAVVAAANYGGGPGAAALAHGLDAARSRARALARRLRRRRGRWRQARVALDNVSHELSVQVSVGC